MVIRVASIERQKNINATLPGILMAAKPPAVILMPA